MFSRYQVSDNISPRLCDVLVDYCNSVLAGVTDRLHPVMNTADVYIPLRVQYKLGLIVIVHRCLQHKRPEYLMDCCIFVKSNAASPF